MSLFDRLVSQALQARPELTAIKAVVKLEERCLKFSEGTYRARP